MHGDGLGGAAVDALLVVVDLLLGAVRLVPRGRGEEGVEVGTFFSFLTALIMAGDPARRLGQLHVGLRKHLAGVAFIYEVLDRESEGWVAVEATCEPGAVVVFAAEQLARASGGALAAIASTTIELSEAVRHRPSSQRPCRVLLLFLSLCLCCVPLSRSPGRSRVAQRLSNNSATVNGGALMLVLGNLVSERDTYEGNRAAAVPRCGRTV